MSIVYTALIHSGESFLGELTIAEGIRYSQKPPIRFFRGRGFCIFSRLFFFDEVMDGEDK